MKSKKADAGLQHASSMASARPWLKQFQFKKGQSGNPSGRRKGAVNLTSALKSILARGANAEQLAEAIFKAALAADPSIVRLVFDRIDCALVSGAASVALAQLQITHPEVASRVSVYLPKKDSFDLPDPDDPLPKLSRERMRQIIELVPEVAERAGLLPASEAAAAVPAPLPEPEPEPPKASIEPEAHEQDRPRLRLPGPMSAEEFLAS
jgi:hypothetical protein